MLIVLFWLFAYLTPKKQSGSGGVSTITADGYQQLVKVCASPHEFYRRFAGARNAGEQESCTTRMLCQENVAALGNGLPGSAEQAAF